jgi:MoaA/NifB/PqqE/SkfB family radical SAM enzyme
LHPEIIHFVGESSWRFEDVIMNTNGCGGARKDSDLFKDIVEVGITSLNFSVDACDRVTYEKQRIGGDWDLLLQSVGDALEAKSKYGVDDCRIRASVVRTNLNKNDIDSGRMEDFWIGDVGVDWLSVSECYYPAGQKHPWAASKWVPLAVDKFQCADPFRRMVITWDGNRTFPCCQGFSAEVDAGDVFDRDLVEVWHSPEFSRLRNHHVARTWDGFSMCRNCPLTHKPIEKSTKQLELFNEEDQ